MTDQSDLNEHLQEVGAIVVNLASLETLLRICLTAMDGQQVVLPQVPADKVDWTRMTDYKHLSTLIREFNTALTSKEAEFKLDCSIVSVRHAFAHGRFYSHGTDVLPYSLCKFGPNQFEGKVRVEFYEVMSLDWLRKTRDRIKAEHAKVVGCHKARGYGGFK